MSAIGDYINLTAWGYEDKYTNTTHSKLLSGYHKTTIKDFNSALKTERDRINSAAESLTFDRTSLVQFENFYNKLVKQQVADAPEEGYKELIDAMLKGANEYVQKQAPAAVVQNVNGACTSLVQGASAYTKRKNLSHQQSMKRSTLMGGKDKDGNDVKGIVDKIQDSINSMDTTVHGGQAKQEELQALLEETKRQIDGLVKYSRKKADSEIKIAKGYNMVLTEYNGKSKEILYSVEQLTEVNAAFDSFGLKDASILDALNYLVGYFSKSMAGAMGASFEALIVYAAEAMGFKIVENAAEDIKDAVANAVGGVNLQTQVLGGNTSHSGLVKANFDGEIFKALQHAKNANKAFKGYMNNGDIIYATKPSQEKIDCEITLNGKLASVSAKNYSFKAAAERSKQEGLDYTAMHLVSGAPALTLLQDEPASFVNQYLNVLVPHYEKTVKQIKSEGGDVSSYRKNVIYYTKQFNAINQVVCNLFSLKALSGYNLSRGYSNNNSMDIAHMAAANVFIISDRDSNQIKVYSVADFYKKGIASGGFKIHNYPTPSLWTKPYGTRLTIQNRIADILVKVHQQKISVNFDVSKLPGTAAGRK